MFLSNSLSVHLAADDGSPSHDIPGPRQSLDEDLVEAQLRLEAGFGTCYVRPADRRSNQKETVT